MILVLEYRKVFDLLLGCNTAAARDPDRLAMDIFSRAGRLLGFAVANLVSLLDPEVVILGGGMAAVADLYLKPLRQAMLERAQPLAAKKMRVVVSKIADTANLLGCARLAWEPSVFGQPPAMKIRSGPISLKKPTRSKKET